MSIESASNISQLDGSWPLPTDPFGEGDNHLRLLKSVLKLQFPGIGGGGYAETILATETDLNFCQGIVSNVQAQLNYLGEQIAHERDQFNGPAGLLIIFAHGGAPPGWSSVEYAEDYMLHIVNENQWGSFPGGNDSPIEFNSAHRHAISYGNSKAQLGNDWLLVSSSNTGTSGDVYRPRYLQAIVGQKD